MGQNNRTRRKFTDEFERDAVEVVPTGGKSMAEVAGELGIDDSTLGNASSRTASTVVRPRG